MGGYRNGRQADKAQTVSIRDGPPAEVLILLKEW